jgi:hypothetical protein
MRGRNRKGPNPLARVHESNGPDVKIRGTASHIAEKYVSLARDAQASGDPVAAENYLQHAEHYYRIIAAAQAQMVPQHQPFFRDEAPRGEDEFEGEGEDEMFVNGAPVPGLGPQPIVAAMPPRDRESGREPFGQPREQREAYSPREGYSAAPSANGSSHEGAPEVRAEITQSAPFGEAERDLPPRRRRRGRRRPSGEAFADAQGSSNEPADSTAQASDELTPEEA